MEKQTEKMERGGRTALGRGLGSLLNMPAVPVTPPAAEKQPTNSQPASASGKEKVPSAAVAPAVENAVNGTRIPGITFLNISELAPFEFQPRREFREESLRELADSIREKGVIQPIVVRKAQKGFQIIAGERRWRAAKIAGLTQVPVVLNRASDREAMEMAIIENVQREDLNCVDEALAYFQLMEDFKMSQEEVAKRVGKNRVTVANLLRLLKLPDVVLHDLKTGKLTLGHAKVLLSITDPATRLSIREKIIERNLSVRDVEQLVQKIAEQKKIEVKQQDRPSRRWKKTIVDRFERAFSASVKVGGEEDRGKIMIQWTSKDQLQQILESLDKLRVQ